MLRIEVVGILILVIIWPLRAVADVIWRKDGSKIEGTIIAEEEKRVQLLVKVGKAEGKIWIDRVAIERIERGDLPAAEFERRLAALDLADLKGHQELLEWADSQNLTDAVRTIQALLPEVERAGRKRANPTCWCRICDALGERPCPACEGKGETVTPCARCDGTKSIRCSSCGNRREGGVLRCKKCSGSGEIEHFDPAKATKKKIKCTDCRGSGVQTCPSCDGKKQQACPACEGKGGLSETCARCGGKPLELCPTCNGSGVQPVPLTPKELELEEAAAIEAAKKRDSKKPDEEKPAAVKAAPEQEKP